MVKKRLLQMVVILLGCVIVPTSALAAITEHDLSTQGDLNIEEDATNPDGYRVYQSEADPSNSAISVGGTATIILDGVNMVQQDGKPAIKIGDNATVTILLQQENKINGDGDAAALQVEAGSLTIGGDGALYIEKSGDGAAIGSSADTDMSGDIIIADHAKIIATTDTDGPAIGAGRNGGLSGTVHITGNADVEATNTEEAAAIGCGEWGDLSGLIRIDGNATVVAVSSGSSGDNGAAIGTGEDGGITETGRIIIAGRAKVTAYGNNSGAAIGNGSNSEEKMEGQIIIADRAEVHAYGGSRSAAIGVREGDKMTGSIQILGHARVFTGVSDDNGGKNCNAGLGMIGSGHTYTSQNQNGSYVISSAATINNISGADLASLLGAQFIHIRLDENNNPQNLETVVVPAVQSAAGAGGIVITTQSLPDGMVGQAYEAELTASGDCSWTAEGLPEGLSLRDNRITGTPLAAGSYEVTIVAGNGESSDKKTFTLTIVPAATGRETAD